mmetsp:Transcript_14863/g.42130  ORF Transcript_14863/g.42130 Transcript_14863/m.42130 type:complete len:191 (-) Transcript_14863:104-676(-)|eukprot:CAMPEP_0170235392 /NCGR_PEP_ID=MMETSP0116_2-20130129/17442_1 /TAXON_ID=400756 /ORGANISM="Durinskia baltica, Strain CSIRO CS-38" /LENGTH=190 /DNA_ID=CAMNT_0010486187 /DNA_START=70 /DNA_END=642 /DNA_ORIENTATION=-
MRMGPLAKRTAFSPLYTSPIGGCGGVGWRCKSLAILRLLLAAIAELGVAANEGVRVDSAMLANEVPQGAPALSTSDVTEAAAATAASAAAVAGMTDSTTTAGDPANAPIFWTLPPAGRALMCLGVFALLSTKSWRLLLLLLALQFSAHMNAGYNGPPPMPPAPQPTKAPVANVPDTPAEAADAHAHYVAL